MSTAGSVPEPDRFVGQTFTDYLVLDKPGGSGIGLVYKAEDVRSYTEAVTQTLARAP
jgi:hypothetical protein